MQEEDEFTEDKLWLCYDEYKRICDDYVVGDDSDNTKRITLECACGSNQTVSTHDGDVLCSDCGLVLLSHDFERVPSYKALAKATSHIVRPTYMGYKHKFHWREHVAQINGQDPSIPSDLEDVIIAVVQKVQAKNRPIKTREDIKIITLKVSRKIPKQVGLKYVKNRKEFNFHRRYYERWITLLRKFGTPPLQLKQWTHSMLTITESWFCATIVAFRHCRHVEECPGKERKCDPKYKCRSSCPNYNFMTCQFLLNIDNRIPHVVSEFGGSTYEYYKPYLPLLKSPKNMEKLINLWSNMSNESNIYYYVMY